MNTPSWLLPPIAPDPLDQPASDLAWALIWTTLGALTGFSPFAFWALPIGQSLFLPFLVVLLIGSGIALRQGRPGVALAIPVVAGLTVLTASLVGDQPWLWQGLHPVVIACAGAVGLLAGPRVSAAVAGWITVLLVAESILGSRTPDSQGAILGYAFAYAFLGGVIAISARGVAKAVREAAQNSLASETLRTQAETARAELDALFDALPDALMLTDPDHIVVFANAAARHLFDAQLVGRPIPAVLAPARMEGECTLTNEIGEEHVLVVTQKEVRRPEGERATAWVLHDVTDREDAQERAARAAELATDAEQRKRRFLANLGHELRTPTAAIVEYVELLRSEVDDPDRLALYERLGGASTSLVELLDDVLDLTTLDAGELPVERRDCSLSVVMDRLEPLLPVSGPLDGSMHTDPDELVKLLDDLQTAAVELRALRRSELVLTLREGQLRATLKLPEVEMPGDQLLDPLGPAGRAGLTLAIAARRVEALQGRLHVHPGEAGLEVEAFVSTAR